MQAQHGGVSRPVVGLFPAITFLLLVTGLASADQDLDDMRMRLRGMIHTSAGGGANAVSVRDAGADLGTYHAKALLHCADCHVMHASKDGVTYNGAEPNPQGYNRLLKAASSVELCLTCHDGVSGVPDVVGADSNSLAERSAGSFKTPGVNNTDGHDLGAGATDLCLRCHSFHGQPLSLEVTCVDCHDPHGNGRVRNLIWASWPEATPDFGLFSDPGVSGMQKYDRAHVAYGGDGTDTLREVTNMCLDCHHVFSGNYYTDRNGNGIPNKHPVSETERNVTMPVSNGDGRGTTDSGHWMSGVGAGFDVPRVRFVTIPATDYSQASIPSPDSGVFCLTCHKAHGSDAPDSLIWPAGASGEVGPSGCDQCHDKSSS